MKQEELADRVGVSRSHIANTIRLLALPLEVQQLLTDEKISAGHARALLAMGDAEAITALSCGSPRRTCRCARPRRSSGGSSRAPRSRRRRPRAPTLATTARAIPNLAEVEEILSEQLATRVVIRMGRRRGQVVIEFGSADDLERIVSEIVGSGPGLAPD